MHSSATFVIRCATTLTLAAMSSLAHAADDSNVSAMRYVSLDMQGDNADSRQYSGTGSFTLGKHMWLQGTLGTLTGNDVNGLGDLQQYGVGTGFKDEHLQLDLNFSNYKNDSSYKQRDVTAALDWIGDRFTVGLDLSHRNTDNHLDTTQNFPTLGLTNVALHVSESLTGNGVGVHASVDITDALNLSLSGMSYSYDSDYQLTSSTNPVLIRRLLVKHPTVSELVYLSNSGVTRSLALLDNSYSLNLSYQFSSVALSAQYLRDKALDSDDVTHTAIINAALFIGEHWMLSPSIGQSQSDQADVAFGGLSVSYNW